MNHLYDEVAEFHYEEAPGSGLYDWRETYPSLLPLYRARHAIVEEVEHSSASTWFDWPQRQLWQTESQEWKILPLIGFGVKVVDNLAAFPKLAQILSGIPELRTAIFSRVGAHTRIKPHRGPFVLSSNVLRCHLGIRAARPSGMWVNEIFVQQQRGEIIVFDDSKLHTGINDSDEDKIVLLIDLKRPSHTIPASWPTFPFPTDLPPGWEAVANHSKTLEHYDVETGASAALATANSPTSAAAVSAARTTASSK